MRSGISFGPGVPGLWTWVERALEALAERGTGAGQARKSPLAPEPARRERPPGTWHGDSGEFAACFNGDCSSCSMNYGQSGQ